MSEHYNTFTAYDYPTKRNRRIRLKRNILGFIFMLSGIGLVFIAMAFH